MLRKCVAASRALAGLKEAARLIPNQDVLINSIPLREARDSSAIENIVTTNDTLFKFFNADPEKADNATKETLRYRTALMQGFKDVQEGRSARAPPCSSAAPSKTWTSTFARFRAPLSPSIPAARSSIRRPRGKRYCARSSRASKSSCTATTTIDPVIRMAAAHYQFEAIHPFTDGNGRTGRILNTLFLIDKGLLDLPILYLSRYINEHRSEYYDRLLAVTTKGAWEAWLLYMLTAVEETSLWTTAKIRAIDDLMDATVDYVSSASPKIYSRELVEVIFTQPYSRIANMVEAKLGPAKAPANT